MHTELSLGNKFAQYVYKDFDHYKTCYWMFLLVLFSWLSSSKCWNLDLPNEN